MSTREHRSEFERLLIAYSLRERDLGGRHAGESAVSEERRLHQLATDDAECAETLAVRAELLASIDGARELFEQANRPVQASEANDPVFQRLERTAAAVADQLRKVAAGRQSIDGVRATLGVAELRDRSQLAVRDSEDQSDGAAADIGELRPEVEPTVAARPRVARRAIWLAGSFAAAAALVLVAFLALRNGGAAPELDPNWPDDSVLQGRIAVLPVESIRGESGWRLQWNAVPGAIGYDITIFAIDRPGDDRVASERALLVRAPEFAARTAWDLDADRFAKLLDSAGSADALSYRVVARDEMGLVLAQSR